MKQLSSDEILQRVNDYLSSLPYDRKPASLYEPVQYVLAIGGKRIRPVSGDSMLVLAYQRVAQVPAQKLQQVLDLFTTTALEIGEGQEYDMTFEERNDVTEDEYIEMIRLKTSVLLACALKMGAILADAPQRDAELIYQLGEQIGLAFQLQDDLLDVYGDPKVFGKAIGGDIVSNKKTYMLINAYNLANDKQRAELSRWINAKTFNREVKVAEVTRLYDEIGIRQLCEQKINSYFEQARHTLSLIDLPDERKQALSAYMDELLHRKK